MRTAATVDRPDHAHNTVHLCIGVRMLSDRTGIVVSIIAVMFIVHYAVEYVSVGVPE